MRGYPPKVKPPVAINLEIALLAFCFVRLQFPSVYEIALHLRFAEWTLLISYLYPELNYLRLKFFLKGLWVLLGKLLAER